MDYSNYDDLELLSMVRETSEEAKDILFDKYKYIIDVEVKKYLSAAYRLGYDYNDLYQDGLVGFADALNNYRDDRDAQLATFITLCVDRSLQVSIRKAGRIKNKLMADYLSLEHVYDQFTVPLEDIISDNSEHDPLNKILRNEGLKELIDDIKKNLSSSEYEVYSLMLSGLKYDEIAIVLNKNLKQVDNTIQRIKSKVKKIVEER